VRIAVAGLGEKGKTLDFEEAPERFPGLLESCEREGIRILAPIRVSLLAYRVAGMVEVEGGVETVVELRCGRCTASFESPLSDDLTLTYSKELPEIEVEGPGGEEEGVELSAEEMGIVLYQGEEIDLRPAVQEQILLALPLSPLCSRLCKGLCPRCGVDLNRQQCECGPSDFNIKFAALKDLKIKPSK